MCSLGGPRWGCRRPFSDLYQRVWADQENPFDEYDGISYIKPFEALPQDVIVRDEYHKIWNFVKGKTLFLTYALVKALQEHIPVSYCEEPGHISIFNSDAYMGGLSGSEIPNPTHTLCLVDSGVNLIKPPDAVLLSIDNYVVQAASPEPDRWRQWSKQRSARTWVMDLWTRDEMENLVRLCAKSGASFTPDPCRYSPLELFDIVGPSPRNCISLNTRLAVIKKPESLEPSVQYGNIAPLFSDSDDLERVIKTGDCPSAKQGQDFHIFFFGEPDVKNPHGRLPQFRYIVPTRYLEDRLSDYIIKKKAKERYRLLCAFAPLPQAFAPVYESYIVSHTHNLSVSLPCYLLSNPDSPSFQLPPGLSLGKLPVEPSLGMTEYRDNTIYVTRPGFPSLDAFIISDNMTRITMVQITVSNRHDLETLGVRRAIDRLKEELPDIESVQWSFLFIAPGKNGKKAAEAQKVYKLELRKEDPKVRIGWISTAD